jgi:hypothetical protein
MVKSEEGKMVPLAKGLELVLDGADISTANRAAAKSNFMEAFEDGERHPFILGHPFILNAFYVLSKKANWQEMVSISSCGRVYLYVVS